MEALIGVHNQTDRATVRRVMVYMTWSKMCQLVNFARSNNWPYECECCVAPKESMIHEGGHNVHNQRSHQETSRS